MQRRWAESCVTLREPPAGEGTLLGNLTFVAVAQSTSYPKKWQHVTQDAREVRSISICGQFIVFPAVGNPSLIIKWALDEFALPSLLNLLLGCARTTLKASFGYICVVHFSWMVKKTGKSCFAVETEKSQLVI